MPAGKDDFEGQAWIWDQFWSPCKSMLGKECCKVGVKVDTRAMFLMIY